MRSVLMFAAAAVAAGIFVPRFAVSLSESRIAARPAAVLAATPEQPATAYRDSVVVPPDASGHFRVEGHVDGQRLGFMIDTGASVIALTANDAWSLGIHPAEHEYTMVLRTANGTVRAAPARLNMVEIGDLTVRDVAAVVMPDGALAENLLGLSFLSRLRHFEFTDGKMVLQQ